MNIDQAVARAHQADHDASIVEIELAKERSKAPASTGLPGIAIEEVASLREVSTTLDTDCIDLQNEVRLQEKNGRATYKTNASPDTELQHIRAESEQWNYDWYTAQAYQAHAEQGPSPGSQQQKEQHGPEQQHTETADHAQPSTKRSTCAGGGPPDDDDGDHHDD